MKAARAVDLAESVVEPWGLAGDRRWLLVDEDGRFVSQREEPSLARLIVTYGPPDGRISVSAPGRARQPGRPDLCAQPPNARAHRPGHVCPSSRLRGQGAARLEYRRPQLGVSVPWPRPAQGQEEALPARAVS